MHATFFLAAWGLVALALFKAISWVVENRRHAAKARELQCQDAPDYPDQGILGLNVVKQMKEADRNKLFPDLLIEREVVMSKLTGRECSTFKNNLLGQTIYFTSDPKNIQAMLATQFADFDLGPVRRGNMGQTLGDGIFVQDGKPWEHSRAMLRPNFARDQVSDLDLEERHVQNLLAVLKPGADGWTDETNIQTLFFRLTIDSATEFLFGESVNSQINEVAGAPETGKRDEVLFSRHFDSAQRHMSQRFRLGDMWWTYNPKEYKNDNKIVKEFVDHYVDLALKKGLTQEKKAEEGHTKEKYVFLEALAEQTRDPVELNAQMLNILLAGRDTTASLLSWLFHQLLRNPEIFTKLRQAVVDTFGTYDDPQEITFATLKGCQYLQYCLNETLRLWTVVPGNARRTNKPTTLPRGGGPDGNSPIYLKAQTDVNYSIHVMHRRRDLWGEDAEEFRPERFQGRRPGWEYLPFNGGPRICIGQQFALTEASYVVVRLLQRFDQITPAANAPEGPIRSNLTLTSCPGDPVTLRLHEAKE
ncbi:cytochrome P450 [Hortaea werneckii]|nr:cytochrome P450 [Hortaea werneckii]KAI7211392.1 cytochrome P450 [Hortaea werneckii]KAI7566104.1 cytochrome P450 [Hortaea werneckii]KAI7615848.1 cytochrome P450 [Hortaea werneckii]KAI7629330.1 cytochrome P450 [Hortaea werneckii]